MFSNSLLFFIVVNIFLVKAMTVFPILQHYELDNMAPDYEIQDENRPYLKDFSAKNYEEPFYMGRFYNRLQRLPRKVKSIVKGDPREFMG